MSIQAISWALKCKITDSSAKFVLICVANYAGEDGQNAFPSVARICRDTALSESTVRAKLDWLRKNSYLLPGDQEISAAYAKRADRVTVCYDLNLRGPDSVPRESTGSDLPHNGVQITAPRGPDSGPNPKITVRDPGPAAIPEGSPRPVTEILNEREKPITGRAANFQEEFRRRFGTDPK